MASVETKTQESRRDGRRESGTREGQVEAGPTGRKGEVELIVETYSVDTQHTVGVFTPQQETSAESRSMPCGEFKSTSPGATDYSSNDQRIGFDSNDRSLLIAIEKDGGAASLSEDRSVDQEEEWFEKKKRLRGRHKARSLSGSSGRFGGSRSILSSRRSNRAQHALTRRAAKALAASQGEDDPVG